MTSRKLPKNLLKRMSNGFTLINATSELKKSLKKSDVLAYRCLKVKQKKTSDKQNKTRSRKIPETKTKIPTVYKLNKP